MVERERISIIIYLHQLRPQTDCIPFSFLDSLSNPEKQDVSSMSPFNSFINALGWNAMLSPYSLSPVVAIPSCIDCPCYDQMHRRTD